MNRIVNFWKYLSWGYRLILVYVVVLLIMAVVSKIIINPFAQNYDFLLHKPSRDFIFGADDLGRSILHRVMVGLFNALAVALIAAIITTIIGFSLGLMAAYFEKLRGYLMIVVDSFSNINTVFLLSILILIIPRDSLLFLGLIFGVITGASSVRTYLFLSLSEIKKDYVMAAKIAGAGSFRIIFFEIAPNLINIVMFKFGQLIPSILVTASVYASLGIGIMPPNPDIGNMLGLGASYIGTYDYLWAIPGVLLVSFTMSLNLLIQKINFYMDPNNQSR